MRHQPLDWPYFISHWFQGDFRGNASLAQFNEGGIPPSSVTNEHFRDGSKSIPVILFPAAGARASVPANLSREFPDLRAMSMTKNERRQTAVPRQDIRILSSLAWFSSPRCITKTTQSWRD